MEAITYCFTFWLHQPCRYLINTWRFLSFKPLNSRLNLKYTALNHKWFSCMYFTWPKIIFLFAYSKDDTSEFSSYSKHGSNRQGDHYCHCYEVTSGLVILLTFTNVSSQISDVLPLRSLFFFFEVFNLKFQIFTVLKYKTQPAQCTTCCRITINERIIFTD
jgi:hypothetical protein